VFGLRGKQWLLLIGIVALAFNLRPAATSIGPVLGDMTDGLRMSDTTAGVVTTLPVLCFALFGALAPWFARLIGMHRVILAALTLTAVGLLTRAEAPDSALFIAATIPALAGMAAANVLLPSIIKLHFPERVGLLTALYTTTLSIGLTVTSALTVPIAEAGGSWRWGLAVWGITAGLAAIPWLGLIAHDVRPDQPRRRGISFAEMARTPTGWWMAGFFGLQSMQAYAIFGWLPEIYRAAGFSSQQAGLLLAVLTAITIPVSFVLPRLAAGVSNQSALIAGLGACYVIGYAGLAAWPAAGAIAWALLIGVGQGAFPLALTLIGLRSRTSEGTAALSGFTQSVGYLIAAIGPFMMGALHDATKAWTVPLIVLIALVVPQTVAGLAIAKTRYVEDELTSQPTSV
jgi:CP family cyanate transporter-like MFS transporter